MPLDKGRYIFSTEAQCGWTARILLWGTSPQSLYPLNCALLFPSNATFQIFSAIYFPFEIVHVGTFRSPTNCILLLLKVLGLSICSNNVNQFFWEAGQNGGKQLCISVIEEVYDFISEVQKWQVLIGWRDWMKFKSHLFKGSERLVLKIKILHQYHFEYRRKWSLRNSK